MTGGLNHLLRIFEICYAPESKEAREKARRIARVKAAKTRRAPVKRQLIIDYLIAHPECKVREVMDACGVSKVYVYQLASDVVRKKKSGGTGGRHVRATTPTRAPEIERAPDRRNGER